MSDLARLEAKLDALGAQITAQEEYLKELRQAASRRQEFNDDLTPIVSQALKVATERLATLEERGYFKMGEGIFDIVDQVVQAYSPEDLQDLGRNIVSILDTIRALTQPEMMALVGEVTEAAENPEQLKPVGLLGAAKASRDEDAQRGMAVLLEVMRRLGKGVKKASRRKTLETHLGPRRPMKPVVPGRRRSPPSSPPPPRGAAPPSASVQVAHSSTVSRPFTATGYQLSEDGFLLDAQKWTPEFAEELASQLGVTLTEAHYRLIRSAREEYDRTKMSPNLRRLTLVSKMTTKEIYQLLPKAPGKCLARIAGLPKPVGCI